MALKNDYTNKSIQQAGDILRAIANAREPMSIPEIVGTTGISRDAVFRACFTMERMFWLRQVGDKYELSDGIAVLWARYKSKLEAQRDDLGRQIEKLEVASVEG